MQSVRLQKLSAFCGMGGTRKKKEKEKCHREKARQTDRKRERERRGVGEKNRGKKAVQTFLTSLGQKFSSPSLHFVLHFCVTFVTDFL